MPGYLVADAPRDALPITPIRQAGLKRWLAGPGKAWRGWIESTRKLLDSSLPEGRRIRLESALEGLAVPLHPGAERYYREVGLIKDSAVSQ